MGMNGEQQQQEQEEEEEIEPRQLDQTLSCCSGSGCCSQRS